MSGRARAAAVLLAFALSTGVPAFAAVSNALASVKLTSQPNGGAELLVTFSQRIPQFTLSGENTPDVELTFSDVQLGAPPSPGSAGAIKSVTFAAKGSGFTMHIALTGSNAIGVNRSANALDILVAGVAAPASLRARSGSPHPTGAASLASVEVVPLKFADVSEIAGILAGAQIAEQSSYHRPVSIFGLPQAAGGAQYGGGSAGVFAPPTPAPPGAERVTPNLAVDRRLNAAVLSGTSDQVQTLRDLIARIDVPAPAVDLDCDVVELTRQGALDAGIDFNSSGAFASASLFATNRSAPQTYAAFAARLLAQTRNGNGRLLASPRVSAPSGQLVTLIDGDALPVVSSHLLGGAPPVVQEDVSYINVGVHVDVQPRVSAAHTVTTHIFAEFSDVTARKAGPQGTVPQVTLRQTSTAAVAADGQPFVIGGFLHAADRTTYTRTPVLGYLPLVGALFRVKHSTREETNLYILITPHIVR